MIGLLTKKQEEELHKAILNYLIQQQLHETAEALRRESPVLKELINADEETERKKYENLLEKKWTSVIRLQKKVLDLETKAALLTEELERHPLLNSKVKTDGGDAAVVPRAPERASLTGHRAPITSVAFHPSFSLLATSSEDNTIKLWDPETGEYERTLKGHTKSVQSIDFDMKGKFLASCSTDLTIKIWDMDNDYKCVKTLHGHDHSISQVKYLPPAGDVLVSASRDKTIKFWDMSTGFCSKTLTGHSEWIRAIAISEDGKYIASGSSDQTVRIWDVMTGESTAEFRFHDHVVECVAFVNTSAHASVSELTKVSVDAKALMPHQFIISGSRDKTIRLHDFLSGQCIYNGHDNWVRGLISHPLGKHILSVSDDKTIRVWDLKTGRCIKTIEAHSHFVTCVSISCVSGLVATGAVDQIVKVWGCQ